MVVLLKLYAKIVKSNYTSKKIIFILIIYRPVCATCVMFDLHLKHEIVPFDEGSKYLRDSIKENSDKGLLKKNSPKLVF